MVKNLPSCGECGLNPWSGTKIPHAEGNKPTQRSREDCAQQQRHSADKKKYFLSQRIIMEESRD